MSSDSDEETSWSSAEVREQAEALLARRGHSRAEVHEKLVERDVPAELADEVCDELVDEGILDDRAFARRQARLLRDKDWGPNQIRRKLRDHGVASGDRDAALEAVGGDDIWLAHCYARFQSEFGTSPEEMSRSKKGKAYRHLERRGFPGWMARRIVLDGYVPEEE